MKLRIEFSGGAELLFGGVKRHDADVPIATGATLGELLLWMRDNMCKERPELFLSGDTVRPGILVLINDVDWEIEGQTKYELKENDTVVFISTLHGG